MSEIDEWMNSPDLEIDYAHSHPSLSRPGHVEPVNPPEADRSRKNPKHPKPKAKKGNKYTIPPEFAMHFGATGTLTEIDALYFTRDVLEGEYIKYEPFRFYLPSGGYKPDIYTLLDGIHTLLEVKPAGWSEIQKNVNASKKSVRELPFYWGWVWRVGYLVKNKKADIESGQPQFALTWIGD